MMKSSLSARSRRASLPLNAAAGGMPPRRPETGSARSTSASYSTHTTPTQEPTSVSTSSRHARNGTGVGSAELSAHVSTTQSSAMQVYVRVRPFSEREIAQKLPTHSTVRIDPQNPSQLTLLDPARGFRPLTTHPFTRCFWSVFQRDEAQLLTKVDTYLVGGMNSARHARAHATPHGLSAPPSARCSAPAGVDLASPTSLDSGYDGAGSAPVMVDANVTHPPYAGQDEVYLHVGQPIVNNTLDGYNGCVFAYGQTGSGKTFTMLGYAPTESDIRARRGSLAGPDNSLESSVLLDAGPADFESDNGDDVVDKAGLDPNDLQGIIPRSCTDLFEGLRAKRAKDSDFTYRVEVSYYEIYNEKVFDLIRPQRSTELRIRNSPNAGPFVEGLTWKVVTREEDVARVIRKGMQERHTAATKFNDRSSRSHAILTFNIVQLSMDEADNAFQMRSKLNLVDLAGSERTGAAGAEGDEFHDGVKINQSLTVLGRVIDRLADLSKSRAPHLAVPYRDSNLTWVLSDSIGGNSQTSMIATISPHSINYEEMRQTIFYASRAQQVVNVAHRNVDPMILQLRELRAQVADLQLRLREAGGSEYTTEYVRGLEKRIKELVAQCGEQECVISQLRAELENAGITDPTARDTTFAGDGAAAAAVRVGKDDGRGGVNADTYRKTNAALQLELTSANKEIVRLQTELLDIQKTAKVGKLFLDTDETIVKLQAKCDAYRNFLRDWQGQLDQYNAYQWRWSTDLIFNTFKDKMNLLLRQCQGIVMDKEAQTVEALSQGERAQLREVAQLQRQHSTEISSLAQQYQETIEKVKKEYAAKEEERSKRLKELSSNTESRLQATRDTYEQEKRRWAQEEMSLRQEYEAKLAVMRTEYQEDLKRLRESLSSSGSDRPRTGLTVQELQERHEQEMKSITQDLEKERQRRDVELEQVKKMMNAELSRKDELLAERDTAARELQEETVKLRRDNLRMQTDVRSKERQLNTEIKDLLLKQENMIAVSSAVVSNYEKNPSNVEKDLDALRAFISDTDYAAFRAKTKERAFQDVINQRTAASARSPAAVEEQCAREVEDIRSTIEKMRKIRSDQQENLQRVQKDVYEQLSRTRGFQAGGETGN